MFGVPPDKAIRVENFTNHHALTVYKTPLRKARKLELFETCAGFRTTLRQLEKLYKQ